VRAVPALAGAALVCTALAAGCSGGRSSAPHRSFPPRTNPTVGVLQATSAGYTVPTGLPAAAPGTLISTRDAPAQAHLLGAQRAWQVLYHSTNLAGRDIAVSGLVLVPKGQPPRSGWPLAAWAHGTSGLADQCAPSIAKDLGNDSSAVREVRALLTGNLAVVASDYPGLGTPGVHTYLIGQADARAVIDSVTAAHSLLHEQISGSWITVGHSEGGQTVLFVAQTADQRAPRWRFLGTVALAPASQLNLLVPFAEAGKDPVEQAYLIYALEGLSTADPSVEVGALLTPQARAVLPDTTTGCIDDITNDLSRHPLDHLLAASTATKNRLAADLGRFDNPDQARAAEPILITQGDVDSDVPEVATNALVSQLCALGDRVDYRTYPGLDHNNLVAGSQAVIEAWITQRFAHAAAPSTC
jgi:Secretory lipase